ncbi:hypothetical protein BH09ACT1_BH09ACT1_22730 [soil metagenome]
MTTDALRIWAAEKSLLSPATRNNVAWLETLLAPDFHAVGLFGEQLSRSTAIGRVSMQSSQVGTWAISEKRLDRLSGGLILLTYVLEFGEVTSRRSSLWRHTPESTQILFHQATHLGTREPRGLRLVRSALGDLPTDRDSFT